MIWKTFLILTMTTTTKLLTNDIKLMRHETTKLLRIIFKYILIRILPVSQSTPVNPSAHSQVYPLTPSSHEAPFIHGSLAHSLTSDKHHNQNQYFRNVDGENMEQGFALLLVTLMTDDVQHWYSIAGKMKGIWRRWQGKGSIRKHHST